MKLLSVLLAFALTQAAYGIQTFDFETTPTGDLPTDNTQLQTTYAVNGGGNVRFFFDANGNNTFQAGVDEYPAFEQIGLNTPDGFENTNLGLWDVAAPGFEAQLGNFFLIDSNGMTPPPPFIAAYDGTLAITELTGEIWDIDGATGRGTEQWLVDVLNSSGQVIATTTSPLGQFHGPNSLDGKPWTFDFTNLPAGAESVRLTFIGTATSGVGYALNDFGIATVPEPASVMLLAVGGLALAIRRRYGKPR
jgi:hypothetical protein